MSDIKLLRRRRFQRGLGWNAFNRFIRNPQGVVGLGIVLFFLFVAIFADRIAPYSVLHTDFSENNLPPFWMNDPVFGTKGDPRHILGTAVLGRDIFSWAIYGTRTSMLLGVVTAPIVALIGCMIGLSAGYLGGRVDNLIMRITDVFYSFPSITIYILIVMILKNYPAGGWLGGLFTFFLAFMIVGWASVARLVRAEVIKVKELQFVEAARSLGLKGWNIAFRHILPNAISPILIWISFSVPQFILTEAILTYLGIGIGSVNMSEVFFITSWGGMFLEGRLLINSKPIMTIVPTVCVAAVSLGFTFVGDALRDALDPLQMQFNQRRPALDR